MTRTMGITMTLARTFEKPRVTAKGRGSGMEKRDTKELEEGIIRFYNGSLTSLIDLPPYRYPGFE